MIYLTLYETVAIFPTGGPILLDKQVHLYCNVFQVQDGGVPSDEAHCLCGVPQNSVIRLLPFLLYINGQPAALGNSGFLFAVNVFKSQSHPNQVAFSPPFILPGPDQWSITQYVLMPHCWEPSSHFSVFFCGKCRLFDPSDYLRWRP